MLIDINEKTKIQNLRKKKLLYLENLHKIEPKEYEMKPYYIPTGEEHSSTEAAQTEEKSPFF